MKTKSLIFFLSLLLLSSCSWFTPKPGNVTPKDDLTQLPPETQEGKNTFGCLVNGQVWRNQGRGPTVTGDNLSATYSSELRTFDLKAIKRIDPLIESFYFVINGEFKGKGIYHLNTYYGGSRWASFKSGNNQNNCRFYTDSLNTGILEITRFDSISPYIVSGRFSFTVATPGCDTVRVTDGRFDVQL